MGDGDRQRSLVCCSPWGHKESDMTEQLNSKRMHQKTQCTHLFLFQDFSLLLRQAVQSLRDHSAMPLKSPVFSFSLQLLTVYLLSLGPQGCCLGSRYSSGLGERRGKGKLKGGVTSCTGPYFQESKNFFGHLSRHLFLTHWMELCLLTISSCKKGKSLAFAASLMRQLSQKGWNKCRVSDSQCP